MDDFVLLIDAEQCLRVVPHHLGVEQLHSLDLNLQPLSHGWKHSSDNHFTLDNLVLVARFAASEGGQDRLHGDLGATAL